MRIRRVYIKKAGGEIASEPCYSAWRGFSYLGYPLDFFEWDDLSQKCLRLDRRTLVVGGTVAVHMALRQIGVEVPEPLNLPQPLMRFAGRRVWETTLAAIRNENKSGFLRRCLLNRCTRQRLSLVVYFPAVPTWSDCNILRTNSTSKSLNLLFLSPNGGTTFIAGPLSELPIIKESGLRCLTALLCVKQCQATSALLLHIPWILE